MGVPVIASWTKNNKITSTEATLDLTLPSGVQAGDLLVIVVGNDSAISTGQFDGNPATVLGQAGWTDINEAGTNVSDAHVAAFYKLATGADTNITVTSWYSVNDLFGFYIRITDVNQITPLNQTGIDAVVDATSSLNIAAVNTTGNNCLAMCGFAFDGGDGGTFGINTADNWLIMDQENAGTGSGNASGCVGYKNMPTSGSTGIANITWTTTEGGAGFQFAILGTPTVGGGGFTHLKSWNGVPIEHIKTINGIPIANIKSINGIT